MQSEVIYILVNNNTGRIVLCYESEEEVKAHLQLLETEPYTEMSFSYVKSKLIKK